MGVLTCEEQNIKNMHIQCVSCLLAKTFQMEVYVTIVVLILLLYCRIRAEVCQPDELFCSDCGLTQDK